MNKILFAFLLLISISKFTLAEDDWKTDNNYKYYAFSFVDNLRIRSTPSLQSNILSSLPKGTVVEVISINRKLDKIDNLSNHWYQVKFVNITGWAFGSYLAHYIKQDNSPIPSKIIIKEKKLLLNEWKSINNIILQNKPIKNLKFVDDSKIISLFKNMPSNQNTKFDYQLNSIFFFKPIKHYHSGNYGDIGYYLFKHPKYGEVWISDHDIHEIADVAINNNINYLLCTTEPILEGDRNKYRILIFDSITNKIIYGTKPFKDVGAYASAKIVTSKIQSDIVILQIEAFAINGCANPFCDSVDMPYYNTFIKIELNKVVSIFEYIY